MGVRRRTAAALLAMIAGSASCGPGGATIDRGRVSPPTPTVRPAPARPPMVAPAGPRLPREVAPLAYQLTLDVDPAQPSFGGEVTIDVAIAAPTSQLWLDARGLEYDDVRVEAGGATTAATATVVADRELVGLELGRTISGPARITIAYRGPVLADDVVGLFRERVGDTWYLFSQFEAMHARRAVPCFDEPGWKVPWEVTLVVPPGLVAAANTPEVARTTRADGKLEVRFAPTPPMVSYLLAIAVGPFDVVDVGPVGRAKVPARVLVPAGRAADAAVAVAQTPKVVAALEDFFDRPLPLAKLDSVAVPSFPGAMENLGLITYASEEILASPSRPADELRRSYLSIAGHEIAHQWFGNLVTLAWWDDLWLNESFATWMAAKLVADLDPRRDLQTERRRSLADAMERDRRPQAPAVRRAVATSAEADAAFDPIAYDKGAALLAMFERAMGPAPFRDAVRAFIAAHAEGSATAADLGAALAAGSGRAADPIAAGLASFLDQPGVPRVELALDCAAAPAVVATVSRAASIGAPPAAPASWQFPLCVRVPDAARVGERCGWIGGAGGRIELDTCPRWLVGNPAGDGYYQVAYAPALARAVQDHLLEVPAVDRGTLADGVIAELSGGRTEIADGLAWADRLLAAPDRHDTIAAVDVLDAIDDQVGAADRPRWQAWLRAHVGPRARALRLRPKAGETLAAASARRALLELDGITGADPPLVAQGQAAARAWLDGGTGLAGEDLALALRLAATGADAALFDRLRDRLAATADRPTRQMLGEAIAAAAAPAIVERAVDLAFTSPLDPFEQVELLGGLLENPAAQERAWSAIAQSPGTLASRLPAGAWPLLVARAGHLCTPAHRAEVEATFTPRAKADQTVALALADVLEEIDDCIARHDRHAASVAALSAGPAARRK